LVAVLVLGFAVQAKADGFKLVPPKSIGGDVVYDFRDNAPGIAGSVSLASFGKENLGEVRVVYASFEKEGVNAKVGAGIGISIPKVLKAMGCQNVPDWFTSSCGVMALIDVQDNIELSPAIYLTAINIKW